MSIAKQLPDSSPFTKLLINNGKIQYMLKISKISKTYKTGDLVQQALDDVSLTLRDNEFVAILGPSGSGKTTLLNIIGGLDRYDEGDLIINDVSTKDYKDRDWDAYRNHTIGFVFQSYNLIPHQNVLANVELALTISGISKKERTQRAKEALEKVGLGDQLHKKPNQMSGGQMQRVAIARALVNNPDILLADEPTGALDTKTSVQIMDLLKEVAKDRLVIMVTHNPELANEYATRIIQLKDGKIISDSRPARMKKQEVHHENMGKSSMSFLTSLNLSFNNLKTKKRKNFPDRFAGSIGIVGIALILALSNGVNNYIRDIQEDTLSEYPLTIYDTGMDLTALFAETGNLHTSDDKEDDAVKEARLLESFLSGTSTNDLKSLKAYFDSSDELYENASSVEYSYPVTPYIYRIVDDNDIRKLNPDETFSNSANQSNPFTSLLSMGSMSMSQFNELPVDENLYKQQYDLLAGKWPEKYDEMVMILTSEGNATDYSLYLFGLKDIKELDALLESYYKGEQVSFTESTTIYNYGDFLGKEFKLVDVKDLYEYDSERKIYVDKSSNTDYLREVVNNGEVLKIVGVVKPNDTTEASMLATGVGYLRALTEYDMNKAQNSEIVKYQLANPELNIFTGKEFGEENDPFNLEEIFSINEDELTSAFGFDFSTLDLSSESFAGVDFSDVDLDINTGNIDLSGLQGIDFTLLLKDINVKVSYPDLQETFEEVTSGYIEYAKNDPATNYSRLADSIQMYLSEARARDIINNHVRNFLAKSASFLPSTAEIRSLLQDILDGLGDYIRENNITDITDIDNIFRDYMQSDYVKEKVNAFVNMLSKRYDDLEMDDDDLSAIATDLYEDYEAYAKENYLPEPSKLIDSFNAYLQTEQGKRVFNEGIRKAVNVDEIQGQLEKNISSVMSIYSSEISKFMSEMMSGFTNVIADKLSSALEDIMKSMQNVFYFNSGAFSNAINVNMDSKSLEDLMLSMASSGATSYASNLKLLNYATLDNPSRIAIYPKDFDSKTRIIALIDGYNDDAKAQGQDEKVISYSDTVATLMGSVTKIVNIISYVLIAFVAISLIVSSIMIGIITYISVLERTREIGILRSLGASKRNISQVFNAETFIVGLLAGIIGIIISYLVIIPANHILHNFLNMPVTASLKIISIIELIFLSVVLTLIGGLIPAKAASRKDPVIALRTE